MAFSSLNKKKKKALFSKNAPSEDPAATRAPPSPRDQQHRSRLRSRECAAPTNAREHLSAGAKGRTSQQRSVPSLELESRWVGAALDDDGDGPGLSASEVTVSECPTRVREGVEVLRRSLVGSGGGGGSGEEEEKKKKRRVEVFFFWVFAGKKNKNPKTFLTTRG